MKAVSLDIETLSTNTDAVVLSIGACVVTPDGVQKEGAFYSRVNIQEQIDAGRSISEGTLRFWFEQDRKVQQSTFGEGDGPSAREVVQKLYSWLDFNGFPGVYCKGPQFDAAILDSMADSVKVERPVNYRKWRDIRTLEEIITWSGHEDLLIATKEATAKWEGAHNALSDAQMQGEIICLAMGLSAAGLDHAAR